MVRLALTLLLAATAVSAVGDARVHDTSAGAVRAAAATYPLPFFYDLYTFRGRGGGTAVVASFAVPAGELKRESVDGGVRYRFDVTLVLADTVTRRVFRRDDSVFVALPRAPGDEHLLYTQLEVLAPPSRSTVHRVIMTDAATPGIGQLFSAPFRIPDYSGTELMVSDIALGQPDATSGWVRGSATLALLPTDQFPSSAFDVYYEIYNLPAGDTYETEIAIEQATDAQRTRGLVGTSIRLRFADEAMATADAYVAELRRVETSLGRGRYRITVTVTNLRTGERASRSRTFEVRGWERGATLVPALPRGR